MIVILSSGRSYDVPQEVAEELMALWVVAKAAGVEAPKSPEVGNRPAKKAGKEAS